VTDFVVHLARPEVVGLFSIPLWMLPVFMLHILFRQVPADLGGFIPFRSRRGDKFLRRPMQENTQLRIAAVTAPAQLSDDDFARAIGLFGVGILRGGPLGWIVPLIHPPQVPYVAQDNW
jgi:hypothetical protein